MDKVLHATCEVSNPLIADLRELPVAVVGAVTVRGAGAGPCNALVDHYRCRRQRSLETAGVEVMPQKERVDSTVLQEDVHVILEDR
jgi:hypothetical protein